jgi:CRP-like cAMP-binding protein
VSVNAYKIVTNNLLEYLPRKERKRLIECCETVNLLFGETLCETNQPIEHVYFPLTAIISWTITVGDHSPLEMGLIGSEGMLGATLVLGVNTAPMRAIVQGPGAALRMTAKQLRTEMRDNPALVGTLNSYLYVVMAQLAHTAACTHFHEVGSRLARWLLMTHDRAHADNFYLTHKYLADMLGVQRSAITIAAGTLHRRNLIKYARGEICILDRNGLEAASCECYGAVINDYMRVFA